MSVETILTAAQRDDLRAVAAMIIPASSEYNVPGADDAVIQADILATLGRDTGDGARGARSSGAACRHAACRSRRGAARGGSEGIPRLGRRGRRRRSLASCCNATTATIACCARSGLELRPPFPKGYALEQGDWSLLDPVKARPPTLRRIS